MAWLFGGVIFCATVVDTLHTLVGWTTTGQSVAGGVFLIIGDGGEMLFITALLRYAVGVFGASDTPRKS